METNRQRLSRKLLRIEALLASFARDRKYVPRGMQRIADVNELPLVLASVARRNQNTSSAWCAWADERRTLFAAARMLPSISQKRGRPVLRISFYDEDGRLMSAAAWAQRRARSWELFAVGPTHLAERVR